MFKFIRISLISVLLTLTCQNQIFAPQDIEEEENAHQTTIKLCEVLRILSVELKNTDATKYACVVKSADAAARAACSDAIEYSAIQRADYAQQANNYYDSRNRGKYLATKVTSAMNYAYWSTVSLARSLPTDEPINPPLNHDSNDTVGLVKNVVGDVKKKCDDVVKQSVRKHYWAINSVANYFKKALADKRLTEMEKRRAKLSSSKMALMFAIKALAIVLKKQEVITLFGPEFSSFEDLLSEDPKKTEEAIKSLMKSKSIIKKLTKIVKAKNKKLLIGAGLLVGIIGICFAVKSWLSKKPKKVAPARKVVARREEKSTKTRACQPAASSCS